MPITVAAGPNYLNMALYPALPPATFGLSQGSFSYFTDAGAVVASRFQNTARDGILSKLEILVSQPAEGSRAILGVYEDNAGVPGSRLLDAGIVWLADGWNAIPGLSLPVTLNTWYWLAFNLFPNSVIIYYEGGPENCQFWAAAWESLPDPFPADHGSGNSLYVMRATVE